MSSKPLKAADEEDCRPVYPIVDKLQAFFVPLHMAAFHCRYRTILYLLLAMDWLAWCADGLRSFFPSSSLVAQMREVCLTFFVLGILLGWLAAYSWIGHSEKYGERERLLALSQGRILLEPETCQIRKVLVVDYVLVLITPGPIFGLLYNSRALALAITLIGFVAWPFKSAGGGTYTHTQLGLALYSLFMIAAVCGVERARRCAQEQERGELATYPQPHHVFHNGH